MQYTTVLFDLDGTLTKSEEGIAKTAIYAAEKMGFTGFTQEQFKVFIGPPLYDSFRKVVGMTEEQAHRFLQKKSMDSGAKMVQTAKLVLGGQ